MESSARHIVIELDRGASPISGRILADADDAQAFSGWIALFAALRAAAGEAANGSANGALVVGDSSGSAAHTTQGQRGQNA